MNPATNYQQVLRNMEHLKLKQMILLLNEVVDFSMKNQMSFIDTLIRSLSGT